MFSPANTRLGACKPCAGASAVQLPADGHTFESGHVLASNGRRLRWAVPTLASPALPRPGDVETAQICRRCERTPWPPRRLARPRLARGAGKRSRTRGRLRAVPRGRCQSLVALLWIVTSLRHPHKDED